jgi:hypothetical protein
MIFTICSFCIQGTGEIFSAFFSPILNYLISKTVAIIDGIPLRPPSPLPPSETASSGGVLLLIIREL